MSEREAARTPRCKRGCCRARARPARRRGGPDRGRGGEAEKRRALEALTHVAAELGETAERLRSEGRVDEADILEANRLMAEDPALVDEVRALAAEMSAVARCPPGDRAPRRRSSRPFQTRCSPPAPQTCAASALRAARLLTGAPAIDDAASPDDRGRA